MLYEMLTGEKPFKGGDAIGTLLFQIASEAPAPATDYRADLPADVLAIIDRCLKKNPDERYQRGSELAAGLRRAIERIKAGGAPPAPISPAAAPAAPAATASAAEKTILTTPETSAGGEGTVRIEPGG